MNISASETEIAAATAYEDLFVKGLFREWASRVLDAAEVHSGQRVLDVACGTGVLAREAAKRVGLSGSVTGLDPHPGMLVVAERHMSMVEADLRGWLPVLDVHLSEELIERILQKAENDLSPFRDDAGRVVFETSAHIISGTRGPT